MENRRRTGAEYEEKAAEYLEGLGMADPGAELPLPDRMRLT